MGVERRPGTAAPPEQFPHGPVTEPWPRPVPEADQVATCALCGRPLADDLRDDADWVHWEVTRRRPVEGPEYHDADFCSQGHAAQWLARPLPTTEPTVPARADGWCERLLAVLLWFCLLRALALMGLGAYALVRLLGGWD
jgi:hypothetical protein